MRRFFNTAGPCDERFHYTLPPEPRLPRIRGLIDRMGYVVVHAPRQSGKTTTLRALARRLTAEGRYAAVHFSCEAAKIAINDIARAESIILGVLARQARRQLPPELWPSAWPPAAPGIGIINALADWATDCPRPLALVFDEIDALRGDSLVSTLSQLRTLYGDRPEQAPWSVVLAGLRDVRDYKVASGGAEPTAGSSSPFNIKVESLRIGEFTRDDVRALLAQHTTETGQPFAETAIERVFELTAGQPWLTNAIAREVTDEPGVEPPAPIEVERVDEAKERLIVERQTHLDSLAARLNEPRVRRVIAPVIEGTHVEGDAYDDDVRYVRDLGLVAPEDPVQIANPIYREVILRVLASPAEGNITAEPKRFVRADGRLDLERLLRDFAAFWVQHGEVLTRAQAWHEVAPQLVLMAWLHRIVNGGGYIDREYGVGRGRIDLLVRWPHAGENGRREWQQCAIELKVRAKGQSDPTPQGLAQLDGYLDRLGLDTGVLAVFDRRPDAPSIDLRTHLETATTPSGRTVTVLSA